MNPIFSAVLLVIMLLTIGCQSDNSSKTYLADPDVPMEAVSKESAFEKHMQKVGEELDREKDSVESIMTDTNYFFKRNEFHTVRAFTMNKLGSESFNMTTVLDRKNPNKVSKKIKKEKLLTEHQVKQLLLAINDSSNYRWGESGCFVPRHAFVFYKNDSIVDHLDICFQCSQTSGSIRTPASRWGGLSTAGEKKFAEVLQSVGYRTH